MGMQRRLSVVVVAFLALPGIFFGLVALLDWLVHRVTGREYTASGFGPSVLGLLALLAGFSSPVSTTLGWFFAFLGRRPSSVAERVVCAILLGLATVATAHFISAYLLPMVGSAHS